MKFLDFFRKLWYTRPMSKISVRVGWKDLNGRPGTEKIVLAEFSSISEMNSFILHEGIPKGTRVLALIRNLEDDFDEDSNNQIA
jgi:hypothetical protein